MNDCQVLISLAMMPELFGVGEQTPYRWNTEASRPGSRLPAPDLYVFEKPVWFEATLREWAATRTKKLVMDEAVLARICLSQRVT